MSRFLISVLGGLVLGIGVGLYLGWGPFRVEYINSPASRLAQEYKDEYTVMVARGYILDSDANGAIQRLRILGADNVPAYVQEVTERYITNSRDVNDIFALVALSEGLGRLTPIMQEYQDIIAPEAAP